ncbi:hypothetical protein A2960_03445 [Candidatus Gottesmanbacteria bacterium RIFCSPLOWO2_01_FULL_39_12b]|uniref:Glycosyltransferase RgtA/B/C/D-like domain-containing protein n=1 Tax=Candidatus Gottesmanbacteria bacterium RIFCSPLOWO2_01_FULL_39_12b TaxID=1798388 RepID=A0A1F6ANS4_9BACT|nr:MAG: hypothetical protein A2960_03445 [Candidatus Gottesmanbacteria bacterium RIFCSPLOWO2_01_FULL_39_12b]
MIKTRWLFIVIFGLALIFRLGIAYFLVTPKSVDTDSVYKIATEIEQGSMVYNGAWKYYNNPPVWMWIIRLLLIFISVNNSSLAFASKLPFIFSDLGIGLLIYYIARKNKLKTSISCFFAALYLFNPLSLLISSYQGQQESLSLLFILASVYIFMNEKSYWKISYFVFSALLLGISATIKLIPLSLIPAFIIALWKRHFPDNILTLFRSSIIFVILTLLPLVLVFIPYIPIWNSVVERVFNYIPLSGVWGLSSIDIPTNIGFSIPKWILIKDYYLNVRIVLLLSYGIILFKRFNLLESVIVVFLTPLVFSSFLAAQHLLWFIPFLIIWLIYNWKKHTMFIFILFSVVSGGMCVLAYAGFLYWDKPFTLIIRKFYFWFMFLSFILSILLWCEFILQNKWKKIFMR